MNHTLMVCTLNHGIQRSPWSTIPYFRREQLSPAEMQHMCRADGWPCSSKSQNTQEKEVKKFPRNLNQPESNLSIAFNLLATNNSKSWHLPQRLCSNVFLPTAEPFPTHAAHVPVVVEEGKCSTEVKGSIVSDHNKNIIRPWIKRDKWSLGKNSP